MFDNFLDGEKREKFAKQESRSAQKLESSVEAETPLELSSYIDFDTESSALFSEQEIAAAKQRMNKKTD